MEFAHPPDDVYTWVRTGQCHTETDISGTDVLGSGKVVHTLKRECAGSFDLLCWGSGFLVCTCVCVCEDGGPGTAPKVHSYARYAKTKLPWPRHVGFALLVVQIALVRLDSVRYQNKDCFLFCSRSFLS